MNFHVQLTALAYPLQQYFNAMKVLLHNVLPFKINIYFLKMMRNKDSVFQKQGTNTFSKNNATRTRRLKLGLKKPAENDPSSVWKYYRVK